jgi:hypothetical protein
MTAGMLLIAGCSHDGTAAAQSTGLCPSCTALGGETGDFPGGDPPESTCPRYDLVPADDELVLESGLRAAVAKQFVQRDLALPAVWRNSDDRRDVLREVSGITVQTGLHAQIEVTGVNRLERSIEPYPFIGQGPADEAACGGLAFHVRVTIESDDGAIVGAFEAGRADVYSETEAVVRASADVKQFTGSLELKAEPGERMVEQLEIYLSARGTRARLTTATPESEDGSLGSPFLELRAGANDGCNIYAFPYDGAEATSRTESIMTTLAATSPYRGFYDHREIAGPAVRPPSTPEETQVSVDFGPPTSVCQGRRPGAPGQRWSRQTVSFEVPAHLHTADAHYDLSAVLHGIGDLGEAGDVAYSGAYFTSDLLTSSQLRDRFGIDISASGAECAALDLHQSNLQDNRLSVWGGSCDPNDSRRIEVLKLAQ